MSNIYNTIIKKILSYSDEMDKLNQREMAAKTVELKKRLSEGETLDDILPEAFALVRAAAKKVLGMEHFEVQLIGGIALHKGMIAEMKTGEGKTLVATCPAYLNALSGNGVHIITVNDYLSKTNKEQMGKVFNYLGLTVGCITADTPLFDRKGIYNRDIIYGTNKEFGFDYLRDNMAKDTSQIMQRELNYAIIDEADSVLIDEARTPLIISGADVQSCDLYVKANEFAKKLVKGIDMDSSFKENDTENCDFLINERKNTIHLTDRGIAAAERFFQIESLGDIDNIKISHCINQAIRANFMMENGKDYIVKKGEVVIVDNFTGRLMDGRRFNDGLHQAIEAKEKVEIQQENRTYATITLQNYFRLYNKLSGMTGTAATERKEFKETYNMKVMVIPTNRPVIRKDKPDIIFKSIEDKYNAIVETVKEKNALGQPVLIGTTSIMQSEELSKLLSKNKIRHQVLNAKQHEREAEIVAQAGRSGTVTIATNMAGRGTDILLGGNAEFLAKIELIRMGYPRDKVSDASTLTETLDPLVIEMREKYKELYEEFRVDTINDHQKVVEAGGLCVIGTEKSDAVRVDNQLRGRAGRQGDPGESQFYISLEDRLVDLYSYLDTSADVTKKRTSKQINKAQQRVEQQYFEVRKDLLDYDDIADIQRKQFYKMRLNVLESSNIQNWLFKITTAAANNIYESVSSNSTPNMLIEDINKFLNKIPGLENVNLEIEKKNKKDIIEAIKDEIEKACKNKIILLGDKTNDLLKFVSISYMDQMWMSHLENIDALKKTTQMTGYGNVKPIDKYKTDSFIIYQEMINDIYFHIIIGFLSIRNKPSKIDNMPKEVQKLAHDLTMKSLTTGKEISKEEINREVFKIVKEKALGGKL